MESNEVETALKEALVDEFEISEEDVCREASLFDTLGLDSLDTVDLVVLIDKVFGVKLDKSDLKNIKTFGALVDLVSERTQNIG